MEPGGKDGEHRPALVSPRQSYMVGLANASMQQSHWAGSAIFLNGAQDREVPQGQAQAGGANHGGLGSGRVSRPRGQCE
jgi:hypothetical protein